jgi:hypothetical protein
MSETYSIIPDIVKRKKITDKLFFGGRSDAG